MLFVSLALFAGSFVSEASVNRTVRSDTSPPLLNLHAVDATEGDGDCGLSPAEDTGKESRAPLESSIPNGAAGLEQTSQGLRQLAATALNVASGFQHGDVTVEDPVRGDWPSVHKLIGRVSELISTYTQISSSDRYGSDLSKYAELLKSLNKDVAKVTPVDPANCPASTTRRS